MTSSSLFVFGEIPTLNSLPLSISGQDLYRRERTAWRSNVGVRWWLLLASHLQWWSSSHHHLKHLDRTWMAVWRTLRESVPCFSGVRGGSCSLRVQWWSYIYTEYVIQQCCMMYIAHVHTYIYIYILYVHRVYWWCRWVERTVAVNNV